MKVLVVDDSAQVRFMLTVLLEDAGMDVETAASGAEALDRLAQPAGLDAVVVDQRMPGLTGIEVARLAIEQGPCPPIVLFSSYLHPLLVREARELGVTMVVKTDLSDLIAALKRLHHITA
jgi:two-component system, chemotaxis family, chemotaxis protein CheY